MAHLLGAESVGVEYPTRTVFDGLTIGIEEGDRIGIVGRNGDGKSTLLRVLAGRQTPDAGQVTRRGGLRIGMLDQADALPADETVAHAVAGDRAEHEWAGDATTRDVVTGLVGDIPWDARIGDLSGGQQRRVALAAVLSREWDVVFLDEPTNHLDVEGVAWLAEHLRRRWPAGKGGIAVVTHDRWFLDAVCETTWEVHDGVVDEFEGGYAAYVLQRVERDRMAATAAAKRRNLLRKELAWLRRGAPARTSKPKFRIEAANALIADEPPVRDSVSLARLAVQRLGKDVVDLLDAAVEYDGRPIIRDVTWRLAPGERTGIVGVNGAGKSTVLGLIAGRIQPDSGRVKHGKTVKIAVLDQRLEGLDDVLDERVSAVVGSRKSSYVSGGVELTPGQLLERLGFPSALLATPVRDLSGGQQRRLQLLLILLDEPNVLLLDEPTNDLDTDMLAAMEDLLDSWPGTLIVVSHDRYLLERVTDQQYAVLDGRLRHLPGGVDEYLRLRRAADAATRAPADVPAPSGAPPSGGLTGADRRRLEKEVASLERRMERANAAAAAKRAELADVDPTDYAALGAVQAEVAALEADAAALEEQWLDAAGQLEAG